MARDLYDSSDEIRNLYATSSEILGFDLAQRCFEGPEEELKQTRVTQPAIFVHSAALLHFLRNSDLKPDMVAGHSLGEYSALYCAGILSFEQGLGLVKVRAELMQQAGEKNAGTMAAIIGLDDQALLKVCEDASTAGVVAVANFNSPSQTVISGAVAGVEKAMELAAEAGAKRTVPLVVGGAFHSPLMDYATDGLKQAIMQAEFAPARVPVYSNVLAEPLVDLNQIKDLLVRQMTSPVCWAQIVGNMIRDGATEFYEIGPGSVLTGLLRRIDRSVTGKALNELEKVI